MEELSGENPEEYFKVMDYEIKSLTRRDTWEIVSSARGNLIGKSRN